MVTLPKRFTQQSRSVGVYNRFFIILSNYRRFKSNIEVNLLALLKDNLIFLIVFLMDDQWIYVLNWFK